MKKRNTKSKKCTSEISTNYERGIVSWGLRGCHVPGNFSVSKISIHFLTFLIHSAAFLHKIFATPHPLPPSPGGLTIFASPPPSPHPQHLWLLADLPLASSTFFLHLQNCLQKSYFGLSQRGGGLGRGAVTFAFAVLMEINCEFLHHLALPPCLYIPLFFI